MKNKYEIKGNEVHIEINHKGNLLVTTIDKEDLDIADSFEGTWYGSKYKDRSTIYVTGTDHNGGDRISLKLHRLIANPKENELVDHKDGNGLNNTKDNLRTCDYKENARNTRVTRNNTSGSVGVSYRKDRRKWRAYITIDGKQKSLGSFLTYEEAKEASEKGRNKHFKDFSLFKRGEKETII